MKLYTWSCLSDTRRGQLRAGRGWKGGSPLEVPLWGVGHYLNKCVLQATPKMAHYLSGVSVKGNKGTTQSTLNALSNTSGKPTRRHRHGFQRMS